MHNTTHRAGTPVNRSQVARDTAHATQPTERAHRWTGSQVAQDTAHAKQHTDQAHR